MKTDRYRKHHEELVKVVVDIQKNLNSEKVLNNSHEIRKQLNILSGIVRIHLAFEDQALYPALLNSNNSVVSEMAKKFMNEMSSIYATFEAYLEKYYSSKAIRDNVELFISDTKGLFEVLSARIDRENKEFYPLIDKL